MSVKTSGGGFRKIYGNFLRESGQLLGSAELTKLGDEYFAVGEAWDVVADQFDHIFKTMDRNALTPISEHIKGLYGKETELINRLKNF